MSSQSRDLLHPNRGRRCWLLSLQEKCGHASECTSDITRHTGNRLTHHRTEPNTGLETLKLRTRAVRDGDYYKITGQKMYTWTQAIAHGNGADLSMQLDIISPGSESDGAAGQDHPA